MRYNIMRYDSMKYEIVRYEKNCKKLYDMKL